MAKQVPVTTQLGETLDAGSAVQFSGGSVEPNAKQNARPDTETINCHVADAKGCTIISRSIK